MAEETAERTLGGPVDDAMSTALLTVTEDESLLLAWELMERTEYHHLPVVDDDGRCVGVVERDELAIACALPATALDERDVGDVLTPMAASVVRGTGIVEAARRMDEHRLDAIAVTDDDGVLVGLLTARDMVAVVAGTQRSRRGSPDRGPVLFRLEPVLPG